MAEDPEDRVLVPVHAVEGGDVVHEGGCGWRDILGGECDRVAIAEPLMSCHLNCVGGYWSRNREAVGRQRLRHSTAR